MRHVSALCRSARWRLDPEVDLQAGVTEHVHKRVEGEPADLPTRQIRDSRLTHLQALGCVGLGQAFLLDELAEGRHHLRTDSQVPGLGGRETQVREKKLPLPFVIVVPWIAFMSVLFSPPA